MSSSLKGLLPTCLSILSGQGGPLGSYFKGPHGPRGQGPFALGADELPGAVWTQESPLNPTDKVSEEGRTSLELGNRILGLSTVSRNMWWVHPVRLSRVV